MQRDLSVQQQRFYANTLLKAYANAGDYTKAVSWFDSMLQRCLPPNAKGFGKLVEAAAKAAAVQEVELHLEHASRTKSFVVDVTSWTMLIDAYARHGRVDDAIATLERMQKHEVQPSAVTYGSLLHACAKGRSPGRSKVFLQQMGDMGFAPEVIQYNQVLDCLAHSGRPHEAAELMMRMEENSVKPDIVSFNTVLNACAKAAKTESGCGEQAVVVLAEMKHRQLQPDSASYSSVVEAFAKAHHMTEAKDWLSRSVAANIKADILVHTTVLTALGEASQVDDAVSWFEDMEVKRIVPDTIAHHCLLKAFAKAGGWHDALKQLQAMAEKGHTRTVVSFTHIIEAFIAAGQVDRAIAQLAALPGEGVKLDAIPYAVVASACGRMKPFKPKPVENVLRQLARDKVPFTFKARATFRKLLGDTKLQALEKELQLQAVSVDIKRLRKNSDSVSRRRNQLLHTQNKAAGRANDNGMV
eukprot:6456632-Amphidinium_carterae.2